MRMLRFQHVACLLGVALALHSRAEDSSLSFRVDVLPVITKAGCNAGTCHGAATGQGGFKLSLLGYDSDEDYDRITREWGGRRIDLAHPTQSLLLKKPSGQLDHEGGRKLPQGSEGYKLLLRWIGGGAPRGLRELHVTGLQVEPVEAAFPDTNGSRALRVTASLSDGSIRNVTALAAYASNDDAIAEVSKTGQVSARGRGITSVMVRYSGQVASARVVFPFPGGADAEGFPHWNEVDRHIGHGLARLGLPASPLSDNAEFLRRVYLDLTGRLPTAEEARAFIGKAVSRREREQVIGALLESDAFVDFWAMKFSDLFLLGGKSEDSKVCHQWLRSQISLNAPFDQIARSLLTATGELSRVGPAHFMTLASDPRDLSEHVGRIFLGTQIACARCHAHPSDRWTQEDYHRFAAYFARVSREGGAIRTASRGEVDHPKTGRPLQPKPLGAAAGQAADAEDRRVELASWMTAPGNPWFAKTLVNRVWKNLFGRGLVEPVDDMRPTNPPVHPELLEALASDFVAHHFDLRHLVRTIASSRTYQLTSRTRGVNREDLKLFSHANVKEMPAQVFADSVAQVTGVADVFDGYPAGTRAVQLIGPAVPSEALDVLGRCQRKRACDGSARSGGGLAQALHLINGSTINDKLRGGILDSMKGRANREILETLYLSALARFPEPAEFSLWNETLDRAPDRAEAVQDLLWTLLNSREFALIH